MKKSILVLASILLFGCSGEETPKDCTCNKVINITTFNSPSGSFGFYVTKNECSGELSRNIEWKGTPPRVGECK
jgi:hypothetical protein